MVEIRVIPPSRIIVTAMTIYELIPHEFRRAGIDNLEVETTG